MQILVFLVARHKQCLPVLAEVWLLEHFIDMSLLDRSPQVVVTIDKWMFDKQTNLFPNTYMHGFPAYIDWVVQLNDSYSKSSFKWRT